MYIPRDYYTVAQKGLFNKISSCSRQSKTTMRLRKGPSSGLPPTTTLTTVPFSALTSWPLSCYAKDADTSRILATCRKSAQIYLEGPRTNDSPSSCTRRFLDQVPRNRQKPQSPSSTWPASQKSPSNAVSTCSSRKATTRKTGRNVCQRMAAACVTKTWSGAKALRIAAIALRFRVATPGLAIVEKINFMWS